MKAFIIIQSLPTDFHTSHFFQKHLAPLRREAVFPIGQMNAISTGGSLDNEI